MVKFIRKCAVTFLALSKLENQFFNLEEIKSLKKTASNNSAHVCLGVKLREMVKIG